MAQQEKALVVKTEDLSLNSETHIEKEKNF